MAAVRNTLKMIFRSSQDHKTQEQEPVARLRHTLAAQNPARLENLEAEIDEYIWVIELETFQVEEVRS
jgi:hypothetical protein